MSSSASGFGTRRGGLAQSYRAEIASRSQSPVAVSRPQLDPSYQATTIPVDSAQLSDGNSVNVYMLKPAVFMRYVSAAIDITILFVLTIALMLCYDIVDGGLEGGSEVGLFANWTLTLLVCALWFVYGIFFESSSWQGTPGKKLTGLVITDMTGQRISFGQSLGRAFGKVLSGIVPFYIPYIMVGVTKRKQSLHDKMVGTLVFRRRDLVNSGTVFD